MYKSACFFALHFNVCVYFVLPNKPKVCSPASPVHDSALAGRRAAATRLVRSTEQREPRRTATAP
jgi:hypothetical protein